MKRVIEVDVKSEALEKLFFEADVTSIVEWENSHSIRRISLLRDGVEYRIDVTGFVRLDSVPDEEAE